MSTDLDQDTDTVERFCEIVIVLRPIDPAQGSDETPLEVVRDQLNGSFELMADVRRVSDADAKNISPTPVASGPLKIALDDAIREAEIPLRELARKAREALAALLKEGALRATSCLLAQARVMRCQADRMTSRAHEQLLQCWNECMPTGHECIKDIIKYAVRCAVVFAVYKLLAGGA